MAQLPAYAKMKLRSLLKVKKFTPLHHEYVNEFENIECRLRDLEQKKGVSAYDKNFGLQPIVWPEKTAESESSSMNRLFSNDNPLTKF